jgi:hypothetical protein
LCRAVFNVHEQIKSLEARCLCRRSNDQVFKRSSMLLESIYRRRDDQGPEHFAARVEHRRRHAGGAGGNLRLAHGEAILSDLRQPTLIAFRSVTVAGAAFSSLALFRNASLQACGWCTSNTSAPAPQYKGRAAPMAAA